jgi:hypothetical protein
MELEAPSTFTLQAAGYSPDLFTRPVRCRCETSKGEAVAAYCEPFATKQMRRNRPASGKNGRKRKIHFKIDNRFENNLFDCFRPFL